MINKDVAKEMLEKLKEFETSEMDSQENHMLDQIGFGLQKLYESLED